MSRRGTVVAAALAIFASTGACGVVNKVDADRYKMGYTAGAQLLEKWHDAEQAVNGCSEIADALAARLDWDSGERLDYMLGCQDSAHGRPSDYE
jgi:hypothetical protein